MKYYNIHEAKTHFSRLIKRVEQGEELVIARGDQPVARLVPITQPLHSRSFGRYAGQGHIADDFDAPLPADLLSHFE